MLVQVQVLVLVLVQRQSRDVLSQPRFFKSDLHCELFRTYVCAASHPDDTRDNRIIL